MKRILVGVAALIAVVGGAAHGVDRPIPAKITLYKPGLYKVVAKGDFPVVENPTINGGVLGVTSPQGGLNAPLPAAGWSGDTSKGFKYKGLGTPTDPCKVVLVKPKVVKAVCKDAGSLVLPESGDIGIALQVGADNYCAVCGGTAAGNPDKIFKRKDCAAPATCPTFNCCGGSMLSFTTTTGSGTCGDVKKDDGSQFIPLTCGSLYFGGGANTIPLPASIPDMGQSLFKFASCAGTSATLAATTAADAGSNRKCTAAGCLFGAPLPITNPVAALSTCVINQIVYDGYGSVNCSTGDPFIYLALSAKVHLDGDLLPGEPGTQPCPICTGGTCKGGPNDGMACVPETSDSGDPYPTSQDCPPPPAQAIGDLPIAFDLSTGETQTAQDLATQPRVFCGFCRDVDGSGNFQQPAQACSTDADCGTEFEACQQRSAGAFGPLGQVARTITAIGAAAGDLGDLGPHTGTLVSVYCLPPTFNPTIDGNADLPGPGAAVLVGDLKVQ